MLDFSFKWNRAIKRIDRAARMRIVARLGERELQPVELLLQTAGVEAHPAAEVLKQLAATLRVDPRVLRSDDLLGDLCRVSAVELPDIPDDLWQSAKLANRMEIGSYDIMYLAESRTPQHAWTAAWKGLDPRPRDEEEWIDAFMAMRLGAFLRFVTGKAEPDSSVSRRAV